MLSLRMTDPNTRKPIDRRATGVVVLLCISSGLDTPCAEALLSILHLRLYGTGKLRHTCRAAPVRELRWGPRRPVHMPTLHLDQNKWIDLATAELGQLQGADPVETLGIHKAPADDVRALFPLRNAQNYEAGKQRDLRRREELATTMTRFTRVLSIAPPHAIAPWEVKRAPIDSFGLGVPVEEFDLFGIEVSHVAVSPSLHYAAPAEDRGASLRAHARQEILRRALLRLLLE